METKKQLKEEYKQKKFKMGVFQVRNTINGKIYVEGNVNLDAIWNRFKTQLNFGNHPNQSLQEDWTIYGQNNFVFEILSELEQKDGENVNYSKELKFLTAMYVEELKPFGERGYNREGK